MVNTALLENRVRFLRMPLFLGKGTVHLRYGIIVP